LNERKIEMARAGNRVQVLLYDEQYKMFERLRAMFGLNRSQFGMMALTLGMRYLMLVVSPTESLSDESIRRVLDIMGVAGLDKKRVRLVDGTEIVGVVEYRDDVAGSSYGQKRMVVDGREIDDWQVLSIEDA